MSYRGAQRLAGAQDHTRMSAADVKAYTAKVNKPPDAKSQMLSSMKSKMGDMIGKAKGSVSFDD